LRRRKVLEVEEEDLQLAQQLLLRELALSVQPLVDEPGDRLVETLHAFQRGEVVAAGVLERLAELRQHFGQGRHQAPPFRAAGASACSNWMSTTSSSRTPLGATTSTSSPRRFPRSALA